MKNKDTAHIFFAVHLLKQARNMVYWGIEGSKEKSRKLSQRITKENFKEIEDLEAIFRKEST